MTGKALLIFPVLCMLLHHPASARAASGAADFPFKEGRARFSIHFGGGTAFHGNYSIFGIGGGYFVADGVEVGLDAETWFGTSPSISQVGPQMRIVLNTAGPIKPYAGAFYRRTFILGYRDTYTVGARAGAFFSVGTNAYFGAGVAHYLHLNCDRTVYSSCSETYPEVLVSIIFR